MVPPSDISRTKPLVRLILNQIGRRLTEDLNAKRRHRVLLMLDEATELGGCMYFVPGSHKEGDIAGVKDGQTTSVALVAIDKEEMTGLVGRHGEPVPVIGGPGTVALFHPWLVHGSGHNMSIHSRWHLYFVYNAVPNTMTAVDNPRPPFKASGRAVPLQVRDGHATPQAA